MELGNGMVDIGKLVAMVGTFKQTNKNQTAIEFKEVITISNPLFRILSYLFVDLDKLMDLYFQNLKQKLGE